MKELVITELRSGGLITNYYCSAKCRHCLYACSPAWEKRYLNKGETTLIARKLKSLGCKRVYLAGGEPFLDIYSLIDVLDIAEKEELIIEYIETDSSWYSSHFTAINNLERVKRRGVNTILVSISPFHNEFIPFSKTKGVIKACSELGITVFPWIEEFYPELSPFNVNKTHSLEEYIIKYEDEYYIENLIARYNVNFAGRAIETFQEISYKKRTVNILEASRPCNELIYTSNFHLDLYANYIPGTCVGLAVNIFDLGKPLDKDKYPLLYILYQEGINGLLELAKKKGYLPAKRYLSKCHLCFDIRRFLVNEKKFNSVELQPLEFYKQFK